VAAFLSTNGGVDLSILHIGIGIYIVYVDGLYLIRTLLCICTCVVIIVKARGTYLFVHTVYSRARKRYFTAAADVADRIRPLVSETSAIPWPQGLKAPLTCANSSKTSTCTAPVVIPEITSFGYPQMGPTWPDAAAVPMSGLLSSLANAVFANVEA
jgi:hypothetical protein